MAEVKFKFIGDDSDLRKRLANIANIQSEMTEQFSGNLAKTLSSANSQIFKDIAKDAVNAAREAEILNRTASNNTLRDAKLQQIEALRRLREERAKEISDLNVLKQIESEAKTVLAEKKLISEGLAQTEKALNAEYLKSGKNLNDYTLKLKEQAEERRKANEVVKQAEKAFRDSEKTRKDAEREAAKQAKETEKRKKQLEQESSEYYKLNKALGAVRKEAKEVLAEMFRMERQGHANTLGYEALRQKAEGLTKQTQYLDQGIKRIDASLGLHQRNVGNYSQALEVISPQFSSINQKLQLFGTSIDELASKPGAIKELGASFVTMGKGILTFLLSPIGLTVTALAGLFMLFKGNKQTVIDFNSGMLDVSKTTGMSGQALQILSNDVIQLSRNLKTVGTNKLTEYASSAGQLGVKGRRDIIAFTESLAMLETASDISGEEGAKEIARLLTLVDGGVQNVKSFGDEIVNLGNSFAASEKEILGNAEAISQNVGIYKIGRQDVLAYATATKALGVEAEVVGSTFQKTLGTFEKSTRSGKGLSDILKVVGGSAKDLQARFKTDASGVFQDYLKGLNDINKALGVAGVNQALQNTGITDLRQVRVISTLVAGYNTLADAMDTVKNAQGAMTEEFGTAQTKLEEQSKRMGIAWDNLVLSIEDGKGVIGRSSVAVIGFFADVIEAMNPVKKATDELSGAYLKQKEEQDNLQEAISPLLNRYNQLTTQVFKSNEEQEELRSITEKIAKLVPTAVTEWDKYGNAISINTGRVNEFNEAHKELIATLNKSAIAEVENDLRKIEFSRQQRLKSINEFAEKGVDVIVRGQGRGAIVNLKDERQALKDVNKELEAKLYTLQSIGGVLNADQRSLLAKSGLDSAGQGMRDYDESKKKKGDLPTLEESEKERLKREKAEAAAQRKADQLVERQRQAIERQRSLQGQIDKLAEQSNRSRLSEDQEQISSIKDKYARMAEDARKFYADPKNAGLKVDLGKLKQAEKFELSEATMRQETKTLVKDLSVQKSLLDEYNSYAEKTSIQEANKRYEGQLDLIKGYKEKLQLELMSILSLEKKAALGSFEGSKVELTQAQKERAEILKKELDDLNRQELAKQDNKFIELLKLSTTNESRIADIRKKYSDAYELLESEKTRFTLEEYEKRNEALKKGQAEEISSVLLPELQKGGDWVNVFEKNAELARASVLKSVDELQRSLDEMLKKGSISTEKYNEILKQIKGVEIQVTVSEKGFGRLKQVLAELKKAEKGSIQHDQARQKLAQEINYWGQGLVSVGDEALNIADQLGLGSEKFREDMALSLDLASDAVNLASSIASGDVVGMVVNGIKTISSAINLFSKDRKIDRKIKEYQQQLEQLSKTYEELSRKMSNSDTNYYTNSDQLIAELKQRQSILEQMAKAEESKKKTDKNKVKEYRAEYDAINKQIQEIENSVRQMRLQTDINSLAQSITDALVGAFEAGENGVDALDKAFDKFIKNSLANSARLKFVQVIIDDMLKQVDGYMSKNDNSLVGFDFKPWENKLNNASKEVNDFLENAYKGLGLKTDSENNSKIAGRINRNISEDTGSAILGFERARFDLANKHLLILQDVKAQGVNYLTIANDKLTALNAIQVNTFNTATQALKIAENTSQALIELKAINKNTSGSTGRTAEGMGL